MGRIKHLAKVSQYGHRVFAVVDMAAALFMAGPSAASAKTTPHAVVFSMSPLLCHAVDYFFIHPFFFVLVVFLFPL